MLYVSPGYERVWGRSCQSLYEQPKSFAEAIHAEDRPRVLAALERERRGEPYEEEYRVVRPDGSVRWVQDRGFAVRNERGEFYRLAGLAEDITEQRQLEEQFRQAQKMEAIGQLAGGVAHDFNNILAAILMHLGLLHQSDELTAEMKDGLKDIERELKRAANLTRKLLLFSRREVAQFEPLDLNALVSDLLKMLRRLLGENLEMEFRASAAAAWVKADPGMLEQVIMNLCVNARDAMPKAGRLSLTTSLTERTAESPKAHPGARPGRFVCLEVADTGCGMDEAVLKRVFEPFFTTKEVGKGTGLGLATVYGIVKQHDGWIEVQSAVGRGTTFRLYFPMSAETAPKSPLAGGADEVPGGSEGILLVEDDARVRRMTSLCLRKLGYAVLEAASGAEALKVWELHRPQIQLLLTDMVMPEGMTGLELAERLKASKATLKIIVSTGYSADLLSSDPLQPGVALLPKPYQPATLAKLLRQCLDEA